MDDLTTLMNDIEQLLKNGESAKTIIDRLGDYFSYFSSDSFFKLSDKDKRRAVNYILSRLSDMCTESTTCVKDIYAYVYTVLLAHNYHLCPHYISSEHGNIFTPFCSWEEEISYVTAHSTSNEREIEGFYYDRCRYCRKECDDRIFMPEGDVRFWCTRDYYKIKPDTTTSRQQKAQLTKEESYTDNIGPVARGICEKLVAENMAKKADDGVNYMFLGSESLYAYIALRATEEARLDKIYWKSFCRFLSLDASSKTLEADKLRTLKKTASEIKNEKRGKPKGYAKIDSIIDEVRRNQR